MDNRSVRTRRLAIPELPAQPRDNGPHWRPRDRVQVRARSGGRVVERADNVDQHRCAAGAAIRAFRCTWVIAPRSVSVEHDEMAQYHVTVVSGDSSRTAAEAAA